MLRVAAPLLCSSCAPRRPPSPPAFRHVAVISRQLFDPELPPEQRRALQEEQLAPLGRVVLEAAGSYYSAAAARLRQRQLDLAATLGACPPAVAAACAFKVCARAVSDGPCG